jgi:hypothetical protein
MVDHNRQFFVFEMLVEQVVQLRLRPHQVHTHGQGAAGEDRSLDLRLGSLVRTHGVKRNVVEHQAGFYLTASLTSKTARPLYSPHLGQARWGSFFSWQFGHSESPLAVRKS